MVRPFRKPLHFRYTASAIPRAAKGMRRDLRWGMHRRMIELTDVTKKYQRPLPVLDSVSCSVGAGEFVYLTGISGAGKTTVFRLLMLMERPDSGQIRFDGEELTRLPPARWHLHRRRVGMVFQDYRLLQDQSIAHNVGLPLQVAGVAAAPMRKRVWERLEQVGLAERAQERVATLSGGEKQLVSIARAMVQAPRALLADEPTGNLDQTMAHRVLGLLQQIHSNGCTVMVATHDLALIRAFRARTLLIRDRKIHEVRLTEVPAAGPAQAAVR